MAGELLEPDQKEQLEDENVETIGDRILKLLVARGVSHRKMKPRLKDVCGVSYEAARLWLSGETQEIKTEYLEKIADEWNANLEWLITGKGSMDADHGLNLNNGHPIAHEVRRVPVLNYVQAGNPIQAIDDYVAGEGMFDIAIDADLARDLGESAFALVIRGDSMEDEFKDGDVVVIDPGVKPLPGDYVVAKVGNEGEATFKKYRSRGVDKNGFEMFELVPLNEDYHTILVSSENPGYIVGTMVEHRRRRRK